MIPLTIDGHSIESQFENLHQLLTNHPSVNHLLEQKYSILLNQTFIAKSEYSNTQLHANDQIEVFVPIQGG